MKRLLIVAALAMMTLSTGSGCRNSCRGGLFGGGGLFGHRNRECCSMDNNDEMPSGGGCDPCGGGSGDVMLGPPPAMIGPPVGR